MLLCIILMILLWKPGTSLGFETATV